MCGDKHQQPSAATQQPVMSSDPAAADTAMPSGSGVSTIKTTTSAAGASPKDASYDWVLKSSDFKGTNKLVWPSSQDDVYTPSLVTGLTDLGQDSFDANVHERKNAIGSGDHEKYCSFLRDANLPESDNPMEATAFPLRDHTGFEIGSQGIY